MLVGFAARGQNTYGCTRPTAGTRVVASDRMGAGQRLGIFRGTRKLTFECGRLCENTGTVAQGSSRCGCVVVSAAGPMVPPATVILFRVARTMVHACKGRVNETLHPSRVMRLHPRRGRGVAGMCSYVMTSYDCQLRFAHFDMTYRAHSCQTPLV